MTARCRSLDSLRSLGMTADSLRSLGMTAGLAALARDDKARHEELRMSELDRRHFLAAAAATVAEQRARSHRHPPETDAMTGTLTDVVHDTDTIEPEIRPFRVNFPDADSPI